MALQTHDPDRGQQIQGRFRRWFTSRWGSSPRESLVLSEEHWKVSEVSVSNPDFPKEPNTRALTVNLREQDPENEEYSSGGNSLRRKLFLRFYCQASEVSVLTNLSGKKLVTYRSQPVSIFEREEFLSEMDSLLQENEFLRRRTQELEAAIQSMISARPELPSPTPRNQWEEGVQRNPSLH
jgi:hypothetical protein